MENDTDSGMYGHRCSLDKITIDGYYYYYYIHRGMDHGFGFGVILVLVV